MSSITVKGIPAPVHRALKARAKTRGRSLNREIIAVLEGAVGSVQVDADAILSHARSVRSAIRGRLTQHRLDQLKRAGRR
jgi:plasmid stability protein